MNSKYHCNVYALQNKVDKLYSTRHMKSYPPYPAYATILSTLPNQPTPNTKIPHEIYAWVGDEISR